MYKIYIKDLPVIISDNGDKVESDDYLILPEHVGKTGWAQLRAGDAGLKKGFLVICKDKNGFLKEFAQAFQRIDAAGGLVQNESGEYLFIYRKGRWDLPKGKIDEGETSQAAALREVEEECGIRDLAISKHLLNTYHVYDHDQGQVLKKTYWYKMACPSQDAVPQEEEGISEAKWFGKADFIKIFANTYPSVRDVLEYAD